MTQAETAQPASATCGNCGATTGGTYCSVCGQDTKLEPPTVTEYFHELLAHFVHLDGKLWRTLGPLFFRPGKLPQDYLANKRARYVKPLKLYLSAIAVAFAAVQFLGWDLGLKFGGPGFDLSFYLFQQVPPPTAVAQGRLSADTIPWALEHVDTPGIRHLKALAPEEQLKVTRKRGIQYLPYLVLGLVPIYAVLLQWVYRAPHRRYAADLIFALYVHSFFLLIFVIEAKLPLALATMLSLWAIVYYALALKRVYGGTWNETWAWRSSNDTVLLDASRYRIAGDRCDAFHVTVFRKLSWARRRADRTRPVPGAASANPATLTLLETVRLKGVASGQSVVASTKCRIKSACVVRCLVVLSCS